MTAAYGKHDIDRLQEELADVRADAANLRAENDRLRNALGASERERERLNALLDTVAGRMEEVCGDLPVDRAADARASVAEALRERGASVGDLLPELGIIRRVMFGKEK